MSKDVAIAMIMCAKAHMSQTDKAGMPYVMHSMRVAANFTNPQLVIIALLHDVLEDSTSTTANDIDNAFGGVILAAVKMLTHINGEDYFDYIKRIKAHSEIIKIKLADLEDNMNILRLDNITNKDMARLNKYVKAYRILNS